jgi:hypothetical protein
VIVQFGISVAAAATHYNHAFKTVKSADAKSVEGLGRPEDKKGGRKPVHPVDVIKVKTGELVASGVSKAAAEQLISAAAKSRKAKLAIKVDVASIETVQTEVPAVDVASVETVPA